MNISLFAPENFVSQHEFGSPVTVACLLPSLLYLRSICYISRWDHNLSTPYCDVKCDGPQEAKSLCETTKRYVRNEILTPRWSPCRAFSRYFCRRMLHAQFFMLDVLVKEDDSDGELFVDEHRASGSRSPGGFAAAYTVSKSSVPSVYREPDLSASVAKAPVAPPDAAPSAPAYNVEAGSSGQVGVGAGTSTETFPTATSGSMALRLNGTGLGDDRVSIPRDGSTLEVKRSPGCNVHVIVARFRCFHDEVAGLWLEVDGYIHMYAIISVILGQNWE